MVFLAQLKIDDFADLGEQSFGAKPSKIQYAVSFQKTRQNGAEYCRWVSRAPGMMFLVFGGV